MRRRGTGLRGRGLILWVGVLVSGRDVEVEGGKKEGGERGEEMGKSTIRGMLLYDLHDAHNSGDFTTRMVKKC